MSTRVADKTALVTGATSGLGREVAVALAERGRHVLVHGRDGERAESLASELCSAGGSAQPYVADLASLPQVRALADQVRADHPALHILINNAGVGAGEPPYDDRQVSEDGYELRLAVNYLAPVLLARLITPSLVAAAPSRIVNVGSAGQSEVDLDDLQFEKNYHGFEAYQRSKFALAAFTFDLAEELKSSGVTVNCLHPATFMDTGMVREAGVEPMNSVEAGTRAVLNLAVGRDGGDHTGQYFDGTETAKAHRAAYSGTVRSRLHAITGELLAPFERAR